MKIHTRDDTEHGVDYVTRAEAEALADRLEHLQKQQCNTVIQRVEFIRGGMGPDTVLVTMVSGQVLQIGQEGANLYENRVSLESCRQPQGGLMFV